MTEASVGLDGGQVSSDDGRVVVVFPPGATDEELTVRVTRLDPDQQPFAGRRPLIGAWDIEAFASGRGMAEVDRFDADVSIYVHLGDEAMSYMNPRTLRLWSLDDKTGQWISVGGQKVDLTGIVFAETNHLSVWGSTADPAVDTAPFSDVFDLNLHSGAATASIPIELPAAPGALVPELALTYDSARMSSMRRDDALGSWVGIGWHLSVGSIREISGGSGIVPAYSLELGGASQLLYPEPGSDTAFLGHRHSYLRVEASDADCAFRSPGEDPCTWTVTDKQGRRYIFGDTDNSRRYRTIPTGARRYYQWDLSRIEDTHPGDPGHSNDIQVTYWQQFTQPKNCGWPFPPCEDYVLSAYPQQITYGYDGVNKVVFNLGYDYKQSDPQIWPYNLPPNEVQLRNDSPHEVQWISYEPPEVMETHRLDSIDVMYGDQLVRSYEFEYTTTDFHAQGDNGYAGKHTLESMTFKGRDGTPLRTMTFDYQDLTFDHAWQPNQSYTWPHLVQSTNGFGGEVTYVYVSEGYEYNPPEEQCGMWHPWSHQVVASRTQNFGAGQPSVVTEYVYSDGPYEVQGDYRGFGFVSEKEILEGGATGYTTDHAFKTTNHKCSAGNLGEEDILTGLEYSTLRHGAGGSGGWLWTVNTFGYEYLAGGPAGCNFYQPFECSYFVYQNQSDQYLRDGTDLRTRFSYDDYGNREYTYQDGDVAVSVDDSVLYTPYHQNTTDWVFLPKYEQVLDPNAGNALVAETSYFYDGAADRETPPTVGDVTAVQNRIDATETANAYRRYDGFGNLIEQSVPTEVTPAENGGSSSIPPGVPYSVLSFDPTRTYVTTETGPLGHSASYTGDFVLGVVTDVLNPNASQVHMRYDEFGRLTKKWDDLDSETYPTTQYEYYWSDTTGPKWTNVIHRAMPGTTQVLWETHCYDGFGRQVQVRTPFTAGSHSAADTHYDVRGRQEWVSNPYEDANTGCSNPNLSVPRTTYSYDPLGEVSQVVNPDGTSASVDRNGLSTTAIDENGHKDVAVAFGRVSTVEEYTGTAGSGFSLYATTSYTSDLLGNLTEVEDDASNLTTMTYDMLGRKTAMSDPDAGDWQYVYDVAGNLIEEVDPVGAHSGRSYDALNRVTSRWSDTPSPPVAEFTYDSYDPASPCSGATAVGQLTKMVDESGTAYWCYDQRGRVVYERKNVDGVNYNVQSTWDSANRLWGIFYPDGEIVGHIYDPVHGQLRGIIGVLMPYGYYLTNVSYNAALQPTSLHPGSGLTATYGYDDRLRVTSVATGSAQNLAYSFDDVGNVASITDQGVQTTFTYDDLDRLVSAGGAYAATYEYNEIGNMTRKKEGAQDLDLLYQDAGHVHAATSVRDHGSGAPVADLAYDGRGNLATEGVDSYGYNMDNLLVSRPGYDYVYDGQGALVKRIDTTTGAWTVYIGGIYEKRSDGTYVKYYTAFGRRIAMREGYVGAVRYLLADHLGSSAVVTDRLGAVLGTMKYYPYGQMRSSTGDMHTDKLFTGQQREPDSGSVLAPYNYGARFYSALTGRFVSVDPLVPDVNDPQALNAYAYVHNNPLVYVDPTGLCFQMPDGSVPDCSEELAGDTVDCALNGANCPKLGGVRLTQESAQAGIQQALFWDNVKTYGVYTYLRDDIILFIFKGEVTDGRLDLIPAYGWWILGYMFSTAGYGDFEPGYITARFLKASIYDIANGTYLVMELSERDIVGAYPWWNRLSMVHRGHIDRYLGGDFYDNALDEVWRLQWATYFMALAITGSDRDINQTAWSKFQRDYLSGLGLVDPWEKGSSISERAWGEYKALCRTVMYGCNTQWGIWR